MLLTDDGSVESAGMTSTDSSSSPFCSNKILNFTYTHAINYCVIIINRGDLTFVKSIPY